jgi:hypothetical protein
MKRLGILAIGLAAIAVSIVTLSSSASSSTPGATPVLGYTVIDNFDGTCDLNSIDLTTGQLTDLPAPSTPTACSADLAVAPDGTVYGIDGDHFNFPGSLEPAADSQGSPHLIEYDADGYASITILTNNENFLTGPRQGGIAVTTDGTIYAQIQDATLCDNMINPTTGLYISDSIPMVCLFTIDPVTGVATLVGPSNQLDGLFIGLTSCASAMRTMGPGMNDLTALSNQPASLMLTWSTVDPSTGAVVAGTGQSPPPAYDCATSGDTVFALDSHSGSNQLGTMDVATGAFAPTVALSDPDAFISWYSFAVATPAAPVTTTTAAIEPSVPEFTG